MVIQLALSSKELDAEDLQELTAEFCQTIVRETGVDARLVEGAPEKGARGEPITLGLIALALLKSQSLVAFFNVLKSYFDREPSLLIDIQREDGAKITISAKNIQPQQIDDTFNKAKEFLQA